MKTCFIIMPVSTPADSLDSYNKDTEHFLHVLECLFIPAVEASSLHPILPTVAGSDVIHGEIVKNLSSADLVLCDMSQLNPNVFFEFGIRTALNKPVALVTDEVTTNIPFDTGIVNYHRYNSSLQGWLIKNEVGKLSEHINKTLESEPDRNSLWKYFGIAHSGFLSTEQATPDDKLSLLIRKVDSMGDTLVFSATEFENMISPMAFPHWTQRERISRKLTLIGCSLPGNLFFRWQSWLIFRAAC